MNAEWLRYFVTLNETGNFHVAAERLHITPQALSKAMAGLERQLGLKLVDRDHRVRGLTAAGEAFLSEAQGILRSMENAERRMAEWRTPVPQGPVTIAGDSLWHHYLLPPLLVDLLSRFPMIRPKLYEMIPDDAERRVAAGEVEIGLLLRPPTHPDLDWVEGMSTPYRIVGRPQPIERWESFGYIVPRLFRRETAQPLDGWPEGKFKRRIAAEVELLETAIHLVESGVGAAFLPLLSVEQRIARGSLAVVAEAPCEFADTLFVVWRRGVRPGPAAREVLSALKGLSRPS